MGREESVNECARNSGRDGGRQEDVRVLKERERN